MSLVVVNVTRDLAELMFGRDDWEALASVGEVVVLDPAGPSPVRPPALFGDVLVTAWGSPRLPDRLAAEAHLRFVAHAGGSIRHVVPRSLLLDGVRASQASAAMAEAVAEFALTLTLALLRHVHTYDRAFAAGDGWTVPPAAEFGRSLSTQRVGVIGASRVGRGYIRLLHGVGVREIAVYDPYLGAAETADLMVRRVELDRLLAESDVVALHAPATPETKHLIDSERLALVRDGAVLVNTARSAIVDEHALIRELRTGRFSAGLDVFDTEPLPADHPLVGLPNVLLTSHRAGATRETRRAQGRLAVDEVSRYLSGRPLLHEVTANDYDRLA